VQKRGRARGQPHSTRLMAGITPSRWGSRKRPGSPAVRGGSLTATGSQPLHCSVRGWLRRQVSMFDHSCASLSWLDTAEAAPRRRGRWRSRGRWWRGPYGPRHQTTLPPQRCAGWFAGSSTTRCPWTTARARVTAAGHHALGESRAAPERAARCHALDTGY
jgi:hypothetical protein